MSKINFIPMKEVKVFVQRENLGYVFDLLDTLETTNYVIVPSISDKSDYGYHVSNLMTNSEENLVMLLTVMPEEKLEAFVTGLNPIFEKVPGGILIFDVMAVRNNNSLK